MRAIVLGAAAGGGFPQWNCSCPNCRRARARDPAARSRTQCSLAVSADGERWCLLNAAPDLRQQILSTPSLEPRRAGVRDSPIEAVVLTGGEIDQLAGLLTLREGHRFTICATQQVLSVLDANPMFDALAREQVTRRQVALGAPAALADGLTLEMFPVPGKVPLYLEEQASKLEGAPEDTVGLRISAAGGASLIFVPGCARLTDPLREQLASASVLLFDGTFWSDDEMRRTGTGTKSAARMGHLSMGGPEGSLRQLADLPVARRIYIHVNNTNPVLCEDSPERAAVAEAGWEVAYDGLELDLP